MNLKDLTILKELSNIENFDKILDKSLKELYNILNYNNDIDVLFLTIVGSVAYGTDTPLSDIDIKGVFLQKNDTILSDIKLNNNSSIYKSTISNNTQDIKLYELNKFMSLLYDNNPDILEMYYSNNECVLYESVKWSMIKQMFGYTNLLTKKCYNTFYKYANSQIYKASGLNKKINNPVDKEKKTPIDFCYVITENIQLQKYLEIKNIEQSLCGLVNIPHSRDVYGLYYDGNCKYRGILKEVDGVEISNELRLSSIPKESKRIALISYNKDGYTKYCKQYKEYWKWVNNRNPERYNDNISHKQNYDGKNISHCVRLLLICKEIALYNTFNIRRTEIDFLLNIKKGLISFDDIMTYINELKYDLELLYNKSTLNDDLDINIFTNIISNIRNDI